MLFRSTKPAPPRVRILAAPLQPGPLDVVGDVHGEREALEHLLGHLGYDEDGRHPQGRHLVFVGDLIDRGPDSPAVLDKVRRLVSVGGAQLVLGNHEFNLLRKQRKDGNDWFWGEKHPADVKYGEVAWLPRERREDLLEFLGGLPLTLDRDDLRVVHAAWDPQSMFALRALPRGMKVLEAFQLFEANTRQRIDGSALAKRAHVERMMWPDLTDTVYAPPMLEAVGEIDEMKQMGNPVRVLTSGEERKAVVPFYSSGKWRFVQRRRWWDSYNEPVPVVVGHYWRAFQPMDREALGKSGEDLFHSVDPLSWHGKRGNVFCTDFSVGGRYHERSKSLAHGSTSRLAALRWPERDLVLDTGETLATKNFDTPRMP